MVPPAKETPLPRRHPSAKETPLRQGDPPAGETPCQGDPPSLYKCQIFQLYNFYVLYVLNTSHKLYIKLYMVSELSISFPALAINTPPPPRWSMCGRYASYWNAFLLNNEFSLYIIWKILNYVCSFGFSGSRFQFVSLSEVLRLCRGHLFASNGSYLGQASSIPVHI